MGIGKHLQELEEALLSEAVRKDPAQVGALLAEEFREFGSSGRIFSKAAILEQLRTESSDRELTLSDFACTLLSPEIALVTYKSARTTSTAPPICANRSSVWVLRDGRWQIVFHQGTPVPE